MRGLNFFWWLPIGSVPEISAEKLNQWLRSGRQVQLIDARTQPEYSNGTVADARFAPLTGMPGSIEKLDFDEDVPVIALCLSGHRSRPAVRWLRSQGIEAYSLQGGISSWEKSGYRLNKTA